MNLLLDAASMTCPSLADTLPIGLIFPDSDPDQVFLSHADLAPADLKSLRSDRILGRMVLWRARCWRITGIVYCPHLHGRLLVCREISEIAIATGLENRHFLKLL